MGGFIDMKIIPLPFTLVALTFLAGCSTTTPHRGFTGFTIIPPIADADPTRRHPVSFRVPTVMQVVRDGDLLAVNYMSLQATNILVGRKMVTGFMREENIYAGGTNHPVCMGFDGGNVFVSGDRVYYLSQNGNPQPGQNMTFESHISIFETDLPAQHLWEPQNRKLFRILWTRSFKETIRWRAA